jgi:uncharacterized protein (DUF2384 family)
MTTSVTAGITKQSRARSKPKDVKPRSSRKRGGTGPVILARRPPNFERLERFFVSQSALARALGVRRDTVRTWREGEPTRLRASSIERVDTMCAVAEHVAAYLPTEKLAGDWLLAPHIGLGGISPAAFIRSDPNAYETVLQLIARDAKPVSVGDVSDLLAIEAPDTALAGLPDPAPHPDADPDFLASLG